MNFTSKLIILTKQLIKKGFEITLLIIIMLLFILKEENQHGKYR